MPGHFFFGALAALLTLVCGTFAIASEESTATARSEGSDEPLRLVVIGLVHGHAEGLLWNATRRDDLELVGIYEPNADLFDRLARKHGIDGSLRYDDLEAMLDETKPEAASVMNAIADHLEAVEACAPRGIHTLLEKPLAFSNADALRMAALAAEHDVHVLTNFETSWYASVREAKRLVESGEMAPVRRMVFRHGHRGPREIGCADEFVDWLTSPEGNGAGALVDFGCYGAILATWMMDGQRPTSIVAATNNVKPDRYPRVDDDATIVLTYPDATAVLQASWAWTHDNKDMDVHTESGSIHARKWDDLSIRRPDKPSERVDPPAKPRCIENEWTHLRGVIRGECEVDPLASLELNLIAVEILSEAIRQTSGASR